MMPSLDLNLDRLDQLAQLPADLALLEAGPLLEALASEPAFLATHVAPLLRRVVPSAEPLLGQSARSSAGGCTLLLFIWPPGARTPIHDHTSWGAYYCVLGSVLEERYVRVDDGAQPDRACLRAGLRRRLRRTDGFATVGPYAEGIHRIANPYRRTAISVHLYGPRLGSLDGRDYDPSRDYVCDRREDDQN
jgi:predicted metal-dependent enzyme (double-stranded beta helix superfamily)